jgi:hypothetical protein
MFFLVLFKNSRQLLIKQSIFNTLARKKVWKRVKIFIPAGQAKVAPPISSILGQFGVNLLDFCETFNARTRNFNSDLLFLVYITIFSNKSYIFKLKPVTLNELFFSFDTSLNFSTVVNISEDVFLQQHKEFVLNFYKLFIVYTFIHYNLKIFSNFKSKFLITILNQILGYLFSFSRF